MDSDLRIMIGKVFITMFKIFPLHNRNFVLVKKRATSAICLLTSTHTTQVSLGYPKPCLKKGRDQDLENLYKCSLSYNHLQFIQ